MPYFVKSYRLVSWTKGPFSQLWKLQDSAHLAAVMHVFLVCPSSSTDRSVDLWACARFVGPHFSHHQLDVTHQWRHIRHQQTADQVPQKSERRWRFFPRPWPPCVAREPSGAGVGNCLRQQVRGPSCQRHTYNDAAPALRHCGRRFVSPLNTLEVRRYSGSPVESVDQIRVKQAFSPLFWRVQLLSRGLLGEKEREGFWLEYYCYVVWLGLQSLTRPPSREAKEIHLSRGSVLMSLFDGLMHDMMPIIIEFNNYWLSDQANSNRQRFLFSF